jgi:adenylate cyclase
MFFFSELKWSNVFRIGVVFFIMTWLLLQAVSILLPTFNAPDWVMLVIVPILGIGFFVALFIAWTFEITSEGIKPISEVKLADSIRKETGQTLSTVLLLLACW